MRARSTAARQCSAGIVVTCLGTVFSSKLVLLYIVLVSENSYVIDAVQNIKAEKYYIVLGSVCLKRVTGSTPRSD